MDLTADPCDDFYRFANGGWLDAQVIPPDRSSWSGYAEAAARTQLVLDEVLEDFCERVARNERNVHLGNWRSDTPVFPHEQIYRSTILRGLDAERLAMLHAGPEIRVLLSRPPS